VNESPDLMLKIKQHGTPLKGFHEYYAGLMATISSCNLWLFWMWMVNAESTTQVASLARTVTHL